MCTMPQGILGFKGRNRVLTRSNEADRHYYLRVKPFRLVYKSIWIQRFLSFDTANIILKWEKVIFMKQTNNYCLRLD